MASKNYPKMTPQALKSVHLFKSYIFGLFRGHTASKKWKIKFRRSLYGQGDGAWQFFWVFGRGQRFDRNSDSDPIVCQPAGWPGLTQIDSRLYTWRSADTDSKSQSNINFEKRETSGYQLNTTTTTGKTALQFTKAAADCIATFSIVAWILIVSLKNFLRHPAYYSNDREYMAGAR